MHGGLGTYKWPPEHRAKAGLKGQGVRLVGWVSGAPAGLAPLPGCRLLSACWTGLGMSRSLSPSPCMRGWGLASHHGTQLLPSDGLRGRWPCFMMSNNDESRGLSRSNWVTGSDAAWSLMTFSPKACRWQQAVLLMNWGMEEMTFFSMALPSNLLWQSASQWETDGPFTWVTGGS